MIEISECSLWILLGIAAVLGYFVGRSGTGRSWGGGYRPEKPTNPAPMTPPTGGSGAVKK